MPWDEYRCGVTCVLYAIAIITRSRYKDEHAGRLNLKPKVWHLLHLLRKLTYRASCTAWSSYYHKKGLLTACSSPSCSSKWRHWKRTKMQLCKTMMTCRSRCNVPAAKPTVPPHRPPSFSLRSTQSSRCSPPWNVLAIHMDVMVNSVLQLLAHTSVTCLEHQGLSEGCDCLLYTSPSPRDRTRSRMPSSA